MDIQIKDGNLVITLPFNEKGTPSSSGKTLVHASTRGNKAVKVNDKELHIGVNVYSYDDQKA